ncbi:hypothetical protein [Serpentinicella alkaliphila]|uniref:Uncharacterized protein n=1 Tax=Serpentinicella alkaliphila TaxID=1734049 RepID=A0A4R2T1L2_9FIRM|nr:hypothetical protein [Serpentinicella alkaliphila]QUH26160.1 hypothetical protein HZR23_10735 [Serpentinicella alkaliphila]TCP94694.1 hypothetical protein EDD79_10738 [Serpentinicella alkaliphila]
MNNKSISILPVFVIVLGIFLNIPEFLMGDAATTKNVVTTFMYTTTWTFVLTYVIKNKNYIAIKCYILFWIITLVFSMLMAYVNVVVIPPIVDWAIPFVIVFLTPWYGIQFLIENNLAFSIVIASISLVICKILLVALKQAKQHAK